MNSNKTTRVAKYLLIKRFLIAALVAMILSSSLPAVNSVAAATDNIAADKSNVTAAIYSDLTGHWAEEILDRWVKAGNIEGYGDGIFAPDKQITRGELAALINRSFGFTESKEIAFTDLAKTNWAYNDLSKAVKAGYLQGYEDGTVRSSKAVSRQEAAVVISRILGMKAQSNAADSFTDSTSIAQWSKAAVGNLIDDKIINGYADGSFKPLSSMTRAEVVAVLDRALTAKSPDVRYDQVGTYGSLDKSQTITGNATVNISGVTLKNMIIKGDLILEAGIGEGDAFFEGVTVQGNTIIRAGGENSIHFTDSILNKVIVEKKQGSVRLVAKGSTQATEIILKSSAIIENVDLDFTGFTNVTLEEHLPAQSIIKFIGKFTIVNVLSSQSQIVVVSGTIKALKISEGAAGTKLTVQEEAQIIQLIADSLVAVFGKGKIEQVTLGLKAEGSTFETVPLKIVRSTPNLSNVGGNGGSAGNGNSNGNNGNENGNGNGGETDPVATISTVRATNGTITVKLAVIPTSEPIAADFTIQQAVYGQPIVDITPSAITGSAITNQYVLSVPVLSYQNSEQRLSFKVSYKSGLAAETASIIVAPGLAITSGGLAQAVIISPSQNDNAKARAAAWKLSKYVKKATGIELNMLTYGDEIPANLLPIYVGVAALQNKQHVDELLQDVNGDGFVIDSVSDSITIIGLTGWGTEFGVDEFLEANVGVRWLMPGVDGEFVPQNSSLTVPKQTVTQNPSFFARTFGSSTREAWAEDNRIYRQLYLNHSMFDLFAPNLYLEAHPDWYPADINPNQLGGWQPCYSNPATAAKAIEVINQYFADNPQAIAYSIAVNDSGGYCEEDPGHPGYTGEINSLGMLNMSDIYFKWVQTVAEGVNVQHADKYLSTIAYHETYDAPSAASNIQLPANVIVYITDERMSWADPVMASKGHELTERWKQIAPGASFYEYLYGGPYVLPRSYFHQMADNYRFAYETGVEAQTTELAPNFGEGPKSWLAAKLQWNATADVDELLHDWYVNAVGADAAPYLAKYYAHWEDFWQNRVFKTNWYKAWKTSSPRTNFMSFNDASYLKIVDDAEIAQSRQWLELAVANAKLTGSASQLVRAQKLLKAFEYYESSVLTYPGNLKASGAITSDSSGIALLDEIVSRLALSEKRKDLVEAFKSDNILSIEWPPEAYGMMWSGIQSSDVQALVEWIKAEAPTGAVRTRMNTIIQTEASGYAVHYLKLMLAMADKAPTLNTNTSFEAGTGKDAEDWWYWLEYGQTKEVNIHRSNENPRTDDFGLKVNGMRVGGPVYELGEVSAGYHGMSAYYYVPEELETEGTLQLFIYYNDANGNVLASSYNDEKLLKDAVSGWNLAEWVGNIPEKVNGIAVKKLQFGVRVNKLKDDEIIYLDDVDFFRLSDPYVPPVAGDTPLNQNSSFENGSAGADDALPWSYWIDGNKFTTTAINRSSEEHKTGDFSLKADSVKAGAVSQILAVDPGNYRMSTWYKTAAGGSTNGKLMLYVDFLNQGNGIMDTIVMNPVLVGDTQGEWMETEWKGVVPAKINGQAVTGIRIATLLSGFAEGEAVYLDDMELYAQEPPIEDAILNENTSFEEGSAGANDALPWSYWIDEGNRFAATAISRSSEQHKKGAFSLKADSVKVGAVSQILAVNPGDYEMSTWYKTAAGGSTNGKLMLYVDLLNQNNSIIGELVMNPILVGDTQGEWMETEWKGTVPAEVNGQAVTRVRIAMVVSNFADGEVVYLDDVELSLQKPAPIEPPIVDAALNVNGSFEEVSAGADDALPWTYWIDGDKFDATTISRSGEQHKTGVFSLKADSVKAGAVSQLLTVEPGDYRMTTSYKTAAGGSANGKIMLYVDFLNESNANIGDVVMTPVPVGDTQGEWVETEWTGTVPTEVNGQAVTRVRIAMVVSNFADGEVIYLDDVELSLQKPAPVEPPIVDAALNVNGSFEEVSAGADDALPWTYWIDGDKFTATTLSRSGEQHKTGAFSLKANSVKAGAVSQILTVEPGDYRMSTSYKTAAGGSATGKIMLYVDFLNESNANIGDVVMSPVSVGDTQGEWVETEWTGTVPTEINGQAVARVRINILITGFADGESVYLDDVNLIVNNSL